HEEHGRACNEDDGAHLSEPGGESRASVCGESDEYVGEGEDWPAVAVGDVESVVEPGAYERDDESCPESYRTRDEAELCECSLVGQSGPSAFGVVGLPVVS